VDSLSYMDNYKPAGSASNPQLDTLVQQILARMRARMATQQQPVIPVQQPQPMPQPSYAPQAAPDPGYQSQQVAPSVQPAPNPVPGMPQVGQNGVTPWVAQAWGGAAPTNAGYTPNPDVMASMNTMPLFPGGGAQTTGDWEIYKKFVSGSVPEFARDYYAQMIAQGRTNDTEQAGFYNASGEIGNMNNGAWG
jgi:hypothetical protein